MEEDGKPSADQHVVSKQSDTSQTTTPIHYQDVFSDGHSSSKNGYVNFATKKPKSIEIEQLLQQASADIDPDDDDQQKKLVAAKKRLFPGAVATSFTEVASTLRNERRQEFCPIYTDETSETVAERQAKRKPTGSLLAKRIRWDDLKRKRDEDERQRALQRHYQYGPYGPVYNTEQSNRPPPPPSFANPYEQYYMAAQHQYDQAIDMARIQQENSGFWPETQQPSNGIQQYSMSNQSYPYPETYSTNMTGMTTAMPSGNTDWHFYGAMQPPPPPPDEPYPY